MRTYDTIRAPESLLRQPIGEDGNLSTKGKTCNFPDVNSFNQRPEPPPWRLLLGQTNNQNDNRDYDPKKYDPSFAARSIGAWAYLLNGLKARTLTPAQMASGFKAATRYHMDLHHHFNYVGVHSAVDKFFASDHPAMHGVSPGKRYIEGFAAHLQGTGINLSTVWKWGRCSIHSKNRQGTEPQDSSAKWATHDSWAL